MTTEKQKLAAEAYKAALQALNNPQPLSGMQQILHFQCSHSIASNSSCIIHSMLGIHCACSSSCSWTSAGDCGCLCNLHKRCVLASGHTCEHAGGPRLQPGGQASLASPAREVKVQCGPSNAAHSVPGPSSGCAGSCRPPTAQGLSSGAVSIAEGQPWAAPGASGQQLGSSGQRGASWPQGPAQPLPGMAQHAQHGGQACSSARPAVQAYLEALGQPGGAQSAAAGILLLAQPCGLCMGLRSCGADHELLRCFAERTHLAPD